MQVTVNDKSSTSAPVKSGVPQGTVLGPLLFLVYINDLPSCVQSKIRLFADDAYLYRVIGSPIDSEILQSDLDELQKWEKQWSMEFHPDKCKVLRVTNKTKPSKGDYTIHNHPLELVDEAKYLGVIIQKRLKWNAHVAMTCKKATQSRIFLQRNLRGCSRSVKDKAYKTYVKPILSYASTVWSPVGDGNQGLRNQLEMVQRKASRFVFADWHWQSSPTYMMNKLNWLPLETQRMHSNLFMMHKIIHQNVAIPVSTLPKRSRDAVRFQPVYGRVNAYKNLFVPTSIAWWNNLPNDIINETMFSTFKSKIEKNL